jgi:hypothetical protein
MLISAKSDKSASLAEAFGLLSISQSRNLFGDFYQKDAKNLNDWMEVYDRLVVTELSSYDALYLIGGLDLHRSNLGRFENRVGVFPRDRGQLKFESAGNHLINILALVKAHNEYGISLHEIAFDPNEMSCDLFHVDVAPLKDSGYYLYHGYGIPEYGAHRLDSLQCWLESIINPLFPEDYSVKTEDFTFGYTVLKNSGREHYPVEIERIASNFTKSNLFVKNEYLIINTHVEPYKYLELIKASRFTYMLPSYNKHCFSVYRFVESIFHDCLPLIHSDCNIVDIGNSFGISEDLQILQSGRIPHESERIDILGRLKSTMMAPTKLFL